MKERKSYEIKAEYADGPYTLVPTDLVQGRYNTTGTEMFVMCCLLYYKHGVDVSFGMLSKQSGYSKSTIARTISSLHKKNFTKVTKHPGKLSDFEILVPDVWPKRQRSAYEG